jgi:hypothetical protein
MTITIDILAAVIALAAGTFAFFIRLEHRLTRIETKLDLHLNPTTPGTTHSKKTPYPI